MNRDQSKSIFRDKKILFSMWDCENTSSHAYQNWYLCVNRIFGKTILFDPKLKRYKYGREEMKKKFLGIIKEEKPDFAWIGISDEIDFTTIKEIKKISPKTITVTFFGDDDVTFETFSRYYALYVDCCLVAQTDYLKRYNEDGRKNVYPCIGQNIADYTKNISNAKQKKIYDVIFIGLLHPQSRADWIRYLIKNGVNVKIWGKGWDAHSEFKNYYGGILKSDEYFNIMNKAKINLNFSRNKENILHLKGRPFELALAKAFTLTEYFSEYLKYFEEDKEIITFKTKEELLKKVNYYLSHDQEREKTVELAYKRALKEADLESELLVTFTDLLTRNSFDRYLPKLNKKVLSLSYEELKDFNNKEMAVKIKNADYISFSSHKAEYLPDKEYLQVYSLEKTGKDISCCNFNVSINGLGTILTSKVEDLCHSGDFKLLNKVISPDILVVKKDFFIKNLGKFKLMILEKKVNLIAAENTSFISMPLVKTNVIPKLQFKDLQKVFVMNFLIDLYSLLKRKRIFKDPYIYKLFIFSALNGTMLPVKTLYDNLIKNRNLAKYVKSLN